MRIIVEVPDEVAARWESKENAGQPPAEPGLILSHRIYQNTVTELLAHCNKTPGMVRVTPPSEVW